MSTEEWEWEICSDCNGSGEALCGNCKRCGGSGEIKVLIEEGKDDE